MSYYEMPAVAVLQMIGELVRPPVSVSSKFGFQSDAPQARNASKSRRHGGRVPVCAGFAPSVLRIHSYPRLLQSHSSSFEAAWR
jgi:hypothetical protein